MKIINLILVIIFVVVTLRNRDSDPSLSFEEAGTDFTKSFNEERKKFGLPIIPENWVHTNPLHYKIQVWENPDTTLPNYSEKTVCATRKAKFSGETDRYNLKKVGKKNYQVVIESNFEIDKRIYTLRKTNPPIPGTKLKYLRFSGEVLDTLTYTEAKDTLTEYGLKILNY